MANKVSVEVNANVTGFQQGMNQASESCQKYETDVRKISEATGNFRKEFAQAKKDALNLAQAYAKLDATAKASTFGKEMAAQLEAAKQKASEMLDMQGDLNQELKNMASDTRVFDTMAEGMGVFLNATSAALGVVAQLTGNEEDAKKAVIAFTTAQSALSAATKIQNALQKQSNTMLAVAKVQTLASTAAVNLETAAKSKNVVVSKAATVAQAAFNKVAMANPYVLLATAIIGVTAALGTFIAMSSKSKAAQLAEAKAAEESKTYHEALNSELKNCIPTYYKLQTEWKNLRTEAEKTKWIKENQTEFNKLGISVSSVTDAENVFVNNTNAVIQALMLRAKAAAQSALAQKKYEQALERVDKLRSVKGRKDLNINEVEDLGLTKKSKNVKDEGNGLTYRKFSVDVDKEIRQTLVRAELDLKSGMEEMVKTQNEYKNKFKSVGIKTVEEAGNAASKARKTAHEKAKKEIAKNSIEEAETKIKEFEDKLKKLNVDDTKAREEIQKKLAYWQKELNERKLKVGIELEGKKELKNSVEEAEAYLKGWQEQLSKVDINDQNRVAIIKVEIAKWQKELNKRKLKLGIEIDTNADGGKTAKQLLDDHEKLLKKQEEEAQAALILANIQHDLDKDVVKLTNEWEKAKKAREDYEAVKKALVDDDATAKGNAKVQDIMHDKTPKTVKDYQDAINTLQDKLNSLDMSHGTEEFDKYTSKIRELQAELDNMQDKIQEGLELPAEKAAKKAQKLADKYNIIADSVASVGDAFSALAELTDDDPVLNTMGIVAQAVANVLAGYAQATVQAASMGPWAWIAFAAAGLATTLAMVAQIKEAAQFAEGGIVGGSSYSGDRIYSRLNSGEMVLNQRQQKNLFNLLDTDTMPQKGGARVQVQGVIHGTDLLLVQKNTNKVRAKSGTQIYF